MVVHMAMTTFEESKHRRANDGKFATKPTIGASAATTADVTAAADDQARYDALINEVCEIGESGEGTEAERVERMVAMCSDPSVHDLENPVGCDACERSMVTEPLSAAGYDMSTAYDGAGDPDVSCCPSCTIQNDEAMYDEMERSHRIEVAEQRAGHAFPLRLLDKDDQGLIDRRFGFTSGEPSSLDDEAARFGVDRNEVRRREIRAMRTLREKGRR